MQFSQPPIIQFKICTATNFSSLFQGYQLRQMVEWRINQCLEDHACYINKIQQDATVCRYLFTAQLPYMFRASIAPVIRST